MKFILWFFGWGSSIVYTALGVLVLIYSKNLGFEHIYMFLTFWNFIGLGYLVLQGLQVQTLKGKNELAGIMDILLSFLPLVVIIASFILRPENAIDVWWILWFNYLFIWLFDIVIFGLQIIRIFRMTSEISAG